MTDVDVLEGVEVTQQLSSPYDRSKMRHISQKQFKDTELRHLFSDLASRQKRIGSINKPLILHL